MFGTIGRARLKSGASGQFDGLMNDWKTNVRPKVPGTFINLIGHDAGDPDALCFVALAQDEATYRNLAALPEQDAWFRRFSSMIEGEVTWQDVEMDWFE